MTDAEIQEYYANLLIVQYHDKPRARAMIMAVVAPVIMNQVPDAINNGFSIDAAVGVQLDTIGIYVGVTRYGYGLSGQPITLDDTDYRQLIKMVIIKNNSGSSLATIQTLLATAFPSQIFVSDNQTMGLNYLIVEGAFTSDLLELIATGGYLPAPMGVQVSSSVVPPIVNPYFGMVSYEDPVQNVSPFNDYNFYNLLSPWLAYPEV